MNYLTRSIQLGLIGLGMTQLAVAADMPNSCPVDGCVVSIDKVVKSGDELKVTLTSNYKPDNAKNHFHMWWGEQYTVEQVGRNAKSQFGVKQGKWHRHDEYPQYTTTGAASTSIRNGATQLCVTAADRGHNVIDSKLFNCVDVAPQLK